jgi:hypothetical protein
VHCRPAQFSSWRAVARAFAVLALGAGFMLALVSCGGSSSETPPPLEPSPANVHYDRSATTLPGELGTPTRPPPSPSSKPATAPAPKRLRPPSSSQF